MRWIGRLVAGFGSDCRQRPLAHLPVRPRLSLLITRCSPLQFDDVEVVETKHGGFYVNVGDVPLGDMSESDEDEPRGQLNSQGCVSGHQDVRTPQLLISA